MQAIMIRPFEQACGCTYVTQYITTSAHKLLADIPKAEDRFRMMMRCSCKRGSIMR